MIRVGVGMTYVVYVALQLIVFAALSYDVAKCYCVCLVIKVFLSYDSLLFLVL